MDDVAGAIAATDELLRVDRTRRGWWARIADALVAELRFGEGTDMAQAIRDWRRAWLAYRDNGERFLVSNYLITLGNRLASTHPELALDFAAIAESDAIAAVAAFDAWPNLQRLAEERPESTEAARQRAKGMSYDAAIDFAIAALDRLIAELDAKGSN